MTTLALPWRGVAAAVAGSTLETGCTIEIGHSQEALYAHVTLDDGLEPGAGDSVLIHGAPVRPSFGDTLTLRRRATLTRAGLLRKVWVRIAQRFELLELFEVSFSGGRIP